LVSLFKYFLFFLFFCILIFLKKKGNGNIDSMGKINNFENDVLKVERVEKKFEIWILFRRRRKYENDVNISRIYIFLFFFAFWKYLEKIEG
jgi:hypothetical protein